jgi:hypothetical protein
MTNRDKQTVILSGCMMMLVEVVLIGSAQWSSVTLILGYLLVSKLFRNEIVHVIQDLETQIASLQIQGEQNNTIVSVLKKKKRMMRQLQFIITVYLALRITLAAGKFGLKSFYVVLIDECCKLFLVVTCSFIFRIRIPDKIHIAVLPDGNLAIIRVPEIVQESNNVEMVME